MKKEIKQAFPCGLSQDQHAYMTGMNLREWYAGMALQGLLANCGYYSSSSNNNGLPPRELSKLSYEYADAMIKEGDK